MPYDVTHMWNLKYDTNEPTYQTDSEHGEHACGCPGGGRGGGLGVSGY